MKSSTRNYLLLLAGILVLSIIGVYAGVLTDTYQTSQYTLQNNSGYYVQGGDGNYIKGFTKTADVVVCRGTSLIDDIIEKFRCDVVCPSTATNCIDYIKNNIADNTYMFIKNGIYPVVSSNLNPIKINNKNFRIESDGAVINATSDGDLKYTFWIEDSDNIYIKGLKIYGNRTCAVGCTINCNCHGIYMNNVTNIYLDNIEVKDFLGFQVFINSNIYTNNVNVFNSKFRGLGTNDVIGGGPSNTNAYEGNINIHDNLLNQSNDIGNYDNAIDIVGLDYSKISNNIAYGGIYYGSETKRTANSEINDNIVISQNYTNIGHIGIINKSSYKNIISNNIIDGGAILAFTNQSNIINNVIHHWGYYYSNYGISSTGDNNLVSSNKIISGGGGIYSLGNYSIISNNIIDNISVLGIANPLSIVSETPSENVQIYGNTIIIEPSTYVQNAIYVGDYCKWNKVYNNKIVNLGYSPQTNLTNFVTIRINGDNSSVSNNDYIGNYTGSLVAVGSNYHYIDTKTYATSFAAIPCNVNNVFNGKTIQNQTNFCNCNGTNWNCWAKLQMV